jgi:hypothetical protein
LPGLIALVLVSSAAAAPIDIPLDTWVRRPLPPHGGGACPTGCKHMRLAYDSANGRIYFCGGDYGGDPYIDSGRQEVWSYSIADSSWRLEYPYCGVAGQVQPMHPDEVGWVYDSRRDKFWMIPGYMGHDTGDCTDAAVVRNEIMTFEPATDRWTVENRQEFTGANYGDMGFAQYDPVTDTIIQFFYSSCSGVAIYDIATDTWTRKCLPGTFFLTKEYTALDLEDRVIYAIEGNENKLYRYDIDSQTIQAVSDTPPGKGSTRMRPVWDSVNRVLLWFDYGGDDDPNGGHLHVYHPDTNTWEVDKPIRQPQGDPVVGVNVVFDPGQNALLVMGSPTFNSPYFFLYRYDNGSGGPARDTTPPSAPTGLHAR